jgi:predicted nucleotidyltransferase
MDKSKLLKELKTFKKLHEIEYGITSLGLFGSFARGEASELSDVDIVVTTKTPDLFNLVHIKEDLEERLKRSVDIVRFRNKMNPFLKNRIEKEAVYV